MVAGPDRQPGRLAAQVAQAAQVGPCPIADVQPAQQRARQLQHAHAEAVAPAARVLDQQALVAKRDQQAMNRAFRDRQASRNVWHAQVVDVIREAVENVDRPLHDLNRFARQC